MKIPCLFCVITFLGTLPLSANVMKDDFEKVSKDKNGVAVPSGWVYYEYFNKDGGILETTEDANGGNFAMHIKSFDKMDEIYIFSAMPLAVKPGEELEASFSVKGKGSVRIGLYLYNQANISIGKLIGKDIAFDSVKWADRKIKLTVPIEKYKDSDVNKVRLLFTLKRNTEIFVDDLILKTLAKEVAKQQ